MHRREHHAGDLPWGWWLRARGGTLEDGEGRVWRTVRDAFWQGELRFPDVHYVPEQHELMTRVLTAIDGRWVGEEGRHDLFGGDMMFWRFYLCWLGSIGLLDMLFTTGGRASPLEAGLSAEGRSVMLMLQATRDPDFESLPIAEVVEVVAAAGRGSADAKRERALQKFERSLGHRRHVFARERVGRSFLITLTGIAVEARMPTRRVSWSQAFADRRGRDDLFAWLAERVERWDDWGSMAHSGGGKALTQHLLTLIVQSGGLTRSARKSRWSDVAGR